MSIIKAHHVALKVKDVASSKAFYTETLGFRVAARIPGKEIYFIDIGGTTIELMAGSGDEGEDAQARGFVHLAFEVDDVDATYEQLCAKGVEFTTPPKSVGDIRLSFFKDPDGNLLELFKSPTLTW